MTPATFLQLGVLVLIICLVLAIKKRPSSFLHKYWAVLLSVGGILVVLLGTLGLIQNNRSYHQFVAENHFEPDDFGGLLFLMMIAFGILLTLATAYSANKQLVRMKTKKH